VPSSDVPHQAEKSQKSVPWYIYSTVPWYIYSTAYSVCLDMDFLRTFWYVYSTVCA
jgi:hypothetical protein